MWDGPEGHGGVGRGGAREVVRGTEDAAVDAQQGDHGGCREGHERRPAPGERGMYADARC